MGNALASPEEMPYGISSQVKHMAKYGIKGLDHGDGWSPNDERILQEKKRQAIIKKIKNDKKFARNVGIMMSHKKLRNKHKLLARKIDTILENEKKKGKNDIGYRIFTAPKQKKADIKRTRHFVNNAFQNAGQVFHKALNHYKKEKTPAVLKSIHHLTQRHPKSDPHAPPPGPIPQPKPRPPAHHHAPVHHPIHSPHPVNHPHIDPNPPEPPPLPSSQPSHSLYVHRSTRPIHHARDAASYHSYQLY